MTNDINIDAISFIGFNWIKVFFTVVHNEEFRIHLLWWYVFYFGVIIISKLGINNIGQNNFLIISIAFKCYLSFIIILLNCWSITYLERDWAHFVLIALYLIWPNFTIESGLFSNARILPCIDRRLHLRLLQFFIISKALL